MKLLLDTHIWIWSRGQSSRLTTSVSSGLEDPQNELWLSPLSIWEFLILVERGRIVLDVSLEDLLSLAMSRVPLREAPVTHEVALEARLVRLPHRDPIDRLLVATARVYDLTFVTADERLMGVQGLSLLANR